MSIRTLFTKIRRRRGHFVDVGFLSPPVFDRPTPPLARVLLWFADNSPERWKLVGIIVLYCCRKGRLQTSGILLFVVTNLRPHFFRRHALHLGLLYTCRSEEAAKHARGMF